MAIIIDSHVPREDYRMIAVTHPGHMGDVLWVIPAARELANRHGTKVDFWTSRVCEPAADLIEAQEFIRHCVVDPGQRVEGGGGGVQPWHMPNAEAIEHGYESIYHFGINSEIEFPIPEYYCRRFGLPQLPNRFDIKDTPEGFRSLPEGPFVCKASKGEGFVPAFREMVRRCPYPVVEVGGIGQAIATDLGAIDRTSKGFLEMTWVISKCRWFVGQMSAPLVVASGFPCVKICAQRPGQGDMRHVVRTPLHHYPEVHDDPKPILDLL